MDRECNSIFKIYWNQVGVEGCGFKDEDVSQLTEVSTDLSINVSVEVSVTVAPTEISVLHLLLQAFTT